VMDGKVDAKWFPVAGHWSIGGDTTVTIQSVLANDSDARATVMTLLSEEAFHRWLPDDEDEIARHFGRDGHTVQSLVTNVPNTECQLDRHDPYGTTTALNRPFPSDWTRDLLGIVADDPVVRNWSIGERLAYRAEAWGAEGGRGEHAWSLTGYRLIIASDALLSLLKLCSRSLVVALKLRKYHRGKSSGRFGDTSAFTHRSLVIVVNERGEIWSPHRISQQAKKALEKLNLDQRRDFYPRFRVIAGLPNEWLSHQKNSQSIDELYKNIMDGLSFE
jgi:hypothetical protein